MTLAVRDVISRLRADGFEPDRTRGSHQMFVRASDGRRVNVQVNHKNRQIPTGALRRMFREAGWEWNGVSGVTRPADEATVRIIKMATTPEGRDLMREAAAIVDEEKRAGMVLPGVPGAPPPPGRDVDEELERAVEDWPTAEEAADAPSPEPADDPPEEPPAQDDGEEARRLEAAVYAAEHGVHVAAEKYGVARRQIKRWMRDAGEDVALRAPLTAERIAPVVEALLAGQTRDQICHRLDVGGGSVSRIWHCAHPAMTWEQRSAITNYRAAIESQQKEGQMVQTVPRQAAQPPEQMTTKQIVQLLKERMKTERIEEMLILRNGPDYTCQVRRMAEEEW